MDYMAIVSMGAFPTPTPTSTVRASLAASWGLLEVSPYSVLKIIFGTMPFIKPLLIPAEIPGAVPGVNENNEWITSF